MKKEQDVKSIAFDSELSVPKKEFDELLRRMAHIKAEEESPNEETDKKNKNKIMENKCYIGIDPGNVGFISIQVNGEWTFMSLKDNDLYQVSDMIAYLKSKYPDIVAGLEQVHAIFNSSAKATFSFGEIYGSLRALLIAHKIPYHLIPPKTWQKEMWDSKDMEITYKKVIIKGKEINKKDVNAKVTSMNTAKRLFPKLDFRRTERCDNLDDNKVDATLICEYLRRKNL